MLALAWGLLVLVAGVRAEGEGNSTPAATAAMAAGGVADGEQLEKALQSLDWEAFKSVVNAIPKLKADVDAYGPLGWQYVEANYRTYRWKKNINKLNDTQKQQLAERILEAQAARPGPAR